MAENTITLSESNCYDLLYRYANIGFTKTGAISISEAAKLYNYFEILLKKRELPENEKMENVLAYVFNTLVVFNSNKAYNLLEANNINDIVIYIQTLFKKEENKSKEPEEVKE